MIPPTNRIREDKNKLPSVIFMNRKWEFTGFSEYYAGIGRLYEYRAKNGDAFYFPLIEITQLVKEMNAKETETKA